MLLESRHVAPISGFVENHSQWPAEVRFFAQAGGIEATLTTDALVLRPAPLPAREGELEQPWPAPVVLRFPRKAAHVSGEGVLSTEHNFILGSDRAKWASHVPGFERVVYEDVVPGIDVVVRIEVNPTTKIEQFAYDLFIAPGARLEDFVIEVDGGTQLDVAEDGALSMRTAAGVVRQTIGTAWQMTVCGGVREPVSASFLKLDLGTGAGGRIGFAAPNRDLTRPFVLDPSLVFATYAGGMNQEEFIDLAVDSSGSTYLLAKVANGTPTTPGAIQTTAPPIVNAWVGKLSPKGAKLVWATYLGGNSVDVPSGLGIDKDGSIVLFGGTFSSDFPVTAGALQPTYSGTPPLKDELFLSRLDPSGSSLIWSTFYGGPDNEDPWQMALFPSGDVLILAKPTIALPSATPGAFDTTFNSNKQFIARISADGTQLKFQTYFQTGRIFSAAIDDDENVYFAGDIQGSQGPLPATPGAFKTTTGGSSAQVEGFVAKLNGQGSQLIWATYLGGETNLDTVWGLTVDAAHAVYAVGQTDSIDFPTTPGAFTTALGGSNDGFVTKLLPGGSGLVWSTYFGGSCCSGGGYERDVAVDSAGNLFSLGDANDQNFPTTPDAFQPAYIGGFPSSDAHFTKFDAFGESLIYSTWFGGSGTDYFGKIKLDSEQDPHLALMSYSQDVPTTPGAYDGAYGGSGDIVVSKFDMTTHPWHVMNGGKPGGKDTPNLAGGGLLTPGSIARVSIRGAPVNSSTLVFAGLGTISVPVLGGTFVPSPDIVVSLATNASGGLDLPFIWPLAPSGISLYLQAWISDPGASFGWCSSNAVQLTSQ